MFTIRLTDRQKAICKEINAGRIATIGQFLYPLLDPAKVEHLGERCIDLAIQAGDRPGTEIPRIFNTRHFADDNLIPTSAGKDFESECRALLGLIPVLERHGLISVTEGNWSVYHKSLFDEEGAFITRNLAFSRYFTALILTHHSTVFVGTPLLDRFIRWRWHLIAEVQIWLSILVAAAGVTVAICVALAGDSGSTVPISGSSTDSVETLDTREQGSQPDSGELSGSNDR